MNKQEFLSKVKANLKGLPKRDVEGRLNFYSEAIDDRIEEGLSEEDAVLALGSTAEIAEQISEEIYAANDGEMDTKNESRPWEIVLLVLGAPVWIPLLIVALAVGFSLYAVLWAINLVFWAVEVPLFIFSYMSKGMMYVCKKMSKGSWDITQKGASFVGKSFRGGKK